MRKMNNIDVCIFPSDSCLHSFICDSINLMMMKNNWNATYKDTETSKKERIVSFLDSNFQGYGCVTTETNVYHFLTAKDCIKSICIATVEDKIVTIYIEFNNSGAIFDIEKVDYNQYIKSEDWNKKRKQKLKEAGYKCQLCGVKGTKLHVHHNSYENLGYEPMGDLIVLCEECHHKFHGINKEEKENKD